MKSLLFVFTVGLAYAIPSSDWVVFKAKHGKKYKNFKEEHFRMNVFLDNKRQIDEHNAKFASGKVSFKLAMNHYGDMLDSEFNALMSDLRAPARLPGAHVFKANDEPVPSFYDWRSLGAVTPVKYQQHCGSCWAFSATGALEAQFYLRDGELVSLSEQNLVDCSRDYHNHGCQGGRMENAFIYVKDNNGINTEEAYPYEARDGPCRFNSTYGVVGTDRGYVPLPEGDEDTLQKAVAFVGPVSVAVNANFTSFRFYSSGVYLEPACNNAHLTHAMLVVGYGSDDGRDYWLVKNSWSANWGERGYIRMARNHDNHCGIASSACFPVL